jgi:hypothetical protein
MPDTGLGGGRKGLDFLLDEEGFVEQMVSQLDASIRELRQRETQLRSRMDRDRVEELLELRDQALSLAEDQSCRRSMDANERELLRVWSRLRRAHSARAAAGQMLMRRPPGSIDNP